VQLREWYPHIQSIGGELLAISNEDRVRAAQLKADLALPFAVLADPTREVIRAYGVFHEHEPKGRPIARPATFVVDAAGVIRLRYVGAAPTDRPRPETVLATLKHLSDG
jgi:peroxiredoxin